jgi:mannosyl-3-phosphoglycerate phosphatase
MPSLTAAWWSRSSGFTSRFWPGHRHDRVGSGSTARRIVLFSDPDTLREEGSQGCAATRGALSALEDQGVAVVLWGNETRSEMELIQSDLKLHHPFISENGGGLFVRHGYFHDRPVAGRAASNYHVVDFGRPYYQVAEALHEVARKVGVDVIGFSDMSIQSVAQDCGLSLAQARLAKLREYDEPFRILDSEPATYSRICSALRRLGCRCFTHEAFHHATGVADKTQSLRMLISLYRQQYNGHVLTVGLAKEPSETCLLQAVDIPIVVQSDAVDTARLGRKVPTARFTSGSSPHGWCEAIQQLVDGQPNAQ